MNDNLVPRRTPLITDLSRSLYHTEHIPNGSTIVNTGTGKIEGNGSNQLIAGNREDSAGWNRIREKYFELLKQEKDA